MKSQGTNKAPTPHQNQRDTGGPKIQNGAWLQLFPQSNQPGKPSTFTQTSGHGTVPKDRRKAQEDLLQGSDLDFSPFYFLTSTEAKVSRS